MFKIGAFSVPSRSSVTFVSFCSKFRAVAVSALRDLRDLLFKFRAVSVLFNLRYLFVQNSGPCRLGLWLRLCRAVSSRLSVLRELRLSA